MLIFRLVAEFLTPLHCGGGHDEFQDQPVDRDAFGYWRVPGSSLAGALRSLAVQLKGKEAADVLFGYQEEEKDGEKKPHASRVWCEDGLFLDYDGKPCLEKILTGSEILCAVDKLDSATFIRDHVGLNLATGAAGNGAKFDCEIVPAGSRFLLEFRCDGWDKRLDAAEKEFFGQLCAQILAGRLVIGGKSGLGYGRFKVIAHACREIDLFERDEVDDWLAFPEFTLDNLPGREWSLPAALPEKVAEGLNGWLEIPLACPGPILIGGGGVDRKDGTVAEGDILFALTPKLNYEAAPRPNAAASREKAATGCLAWAPVLPASSLKGVLRHAIYKILEALGVGESQACQLLRGLFGSEKPGEAAQGKLALEDCALECGGHKPHYQLSQHVAIDRFSAAPLTGALFSEEPFWNPGATASLRVMAKDLQGHEAALLFHALFDLFDGQTAIGSGVNRGNGRLVLQGWREDPVQALARVSGDMTWQGRPLCEGGQLGRNLGLVSESWDAMLKEKISHV